jgi:Putative translation factor (SUA5)
VKAREEGRPVLVVVANRSHLKALAASVSEAAERCMRAILAGAAALLSPRAGLHEALIGPDGKVCVRETAHPAARALCLDWGGGLTSTSANLSGRPPAVAAREACLEGVSLVLDGGALAPVTALDGV